MEQGECRSSKSIVEKNHTKELIGCKIKIVKSQHKNKRIKQMLPVFRQAEVSINLNTVDLNLNGLYCYG